MGLINIEEKVIEIARGIMFSQPHSAINLDTTADHVRADSLDLIEFIMEIEEVFRVEIADERAELFTDLKSVCHFLNVECWP